MPRMIEAIPGYSDEPMEVYNVDDPADVELLKRKEAPKQSDWVHGTQEVEARDYKHRPLGSIPGITYAGFELSDRPDQLIQPKDYEDRLAQAHRDKTLPMYHQYNTWAPENEFAYYQNGLGYCWTWSGTGCFMDLRAILGLSTILLAPVSMGFLVNWANRGNYLESFIRGAQQRGICPAVNGDVNSTNRSSTFWQQYEEQRINFRLGEVWDINTRNAAACVQECLSCLCYSLPIYIAYNWWSHALNLTALMWDTTKLDNLLWLIRNSHGEKKVIVLEGTKARPSEAYAFVSMQPTSAA